MAVLRQGAVDGMEGGDKRVDGQRGAELRELERFLSDPSHDPDSTFGGLRRTVWTHGDKAGQAFWTLIKDEEEIEKVVRDQNKRKRRDPDGINVVAVDESGPIAGSGGGGDGGVDFSGEAASLPQLVLQQQEDIAQLQ
ncbi:MAG: hypothetical protein WCL38_04640, partial [Actinomycetota bacterium]